MRVQWDGCGFPDCDQPYERCQAHHETAAWEDGGLTNTDDMIPLCNGHHRLKHQAGWTITMDADPTVRARRPDGCELADTRRRITQAEPASTTNPTANPTAKTAEMQPPAASTETATVDEPIVVSPLILIDGWGVKRTNVIEFGTIRQRRAMFRQLAGYRDDEQAG